MDISGSYLGRIKKWVNEQFIPHIANANAHHTDHQAAPAEDAEFKSCNIAAGEAYKQNSIDVFRVKPTGNIFIGENAGIITTGFFNTFIGYNVGFMNTSGYCNSFISYNAGGKNTSGYKNIFIGYFAGSNNTIGFSNIFIGYGSGYSNINGRGSVFIGSYAGYFETTSNKLYIANTNTVTPLIWGDFTNYKIGIHMKPAISKFGVAGIVEYADNAAAVTAGLTIGEFYRTGDILKIVHA